jgi:hypothetical protein
VYEVPALNLKKLDSSAAVEFPRELSVYEVTDTSAIEVTVSPEGGVEKSEGVSGKIDALKEVAEKTLKKYARFEPHLIGPVRTEIKISAARNQSTANMERAARDA